MYRILAGWMPFLFFFLVPLSAGLQLHGVQKSGTKLSDELAILDGAATNLRAIRQCDYLVRVKEDFDSVNSAKGVDEKGAVVERIGFYRIAIDFETSRAACFRIEQQNYLDLAAGTSQSPRFQEFETQRGICQDGAGESATIRAVTFPNTRQVTPWQLSEGRGSSFLSALEIPDFRCAGVLSSQASELERIVKTLDLVKSEWIVVQADEPSEGVLKLRMERRDLEPKGVVFARTVTFDLNSLMPLGSQGEILFRDKGQIERGEKGIWQKTEHFETRWTELNGIFLPEHIESEKYFTVSVNGRDQSGEQIRELDFHWFGVNEELDPRLFSGEFLESLDKMMELLDPEICGADRLKIIRPNVGK